MKVVQDLLATLVATPSQAGIDDLAVVVGVIGGWLDRHRVAHRVLASARRPAAIVINPPQHADDEVLVLNACVDTAPAGDLGAWRHPPFAAQVEEGWLYGRGSADSKAAVALFCTLARRLALNPPGRRGGPRRRVTLVFDCDEHSGRFGGIRAYTREFGFPRHCAIGYPGIDEIGHGSRGFYRTVLTLRGAMGHSGSGAVPTELATTKLALLVQALDRFSAAACPAGDGFPFGPRASVTGLRTGPRTYSVTAARIECAIDIRLTPSFGPDAAAALLARTLAGIGRRCGNVHPSTLAPAAVWPAYLTPEDALLPRLLQDSAAAVLGAAPPLAVCGPSNIGNYLAQHGTQLLCGFGVDFRNLHGPDECARLDTLGPVLRIYEAVVRGFLTR